VPRSSFRLLDGRTGWETSSVVNLVGIEDPSGIRLTPREPLGGGVHISQLAAYLPPARAAWAPSGKVFAAAAQQLLLRDPCTGDVSVGHLAVQPVDLVALSSARGLLAVADRGSGFVELVRAADLRTVLRIDVLHLVGGAPSLVALTPWAMLAVITQRPYVFALIGFDGVIRRMRPLPEARLAAELGMVCVESDQTGVRNELVMAMRTESAWRRLLRLDRLTLEAFPIDFTSFRPQPASAVDIAVDDSGTWTVSTSRGHAATFDRYGEQVTNGNDPEGEAQPGRRLLVEEGRLLTLPVDSGVDDCEWHRIRLDADEPPGTWVELKVATMATNDQPDTDLGWQTVAGSDALIQETRGAYLQGRYLRLDLQLHGNGVSTPVVRRITVEYAAATSLDLLPAVYREDAVAADFTRRFLSLFDSTLDDLDDVIEQAPLLFDPRGFPDRAVGALARLVGIRPNPAWPATKLRELLALWPKIRPLLGTPAALRQAVSAVYDVDVLVEEVGRERPWGAVGQARLGDVRLFGTARASLRLGSGRLGQARLNPQADPLAAAFGSGAHQCVIHVPATLPLADRPGLEALVRELLPSHLAVRIRYAARSFTLGLGLRVGIDTTFEVSPSGVLAARDARGIVLRRQGPLSRNPRGGAAVTVGRRLGGGITPTVR